MNEYENVADSDTQKVKATEGERMKNITLNGTKISLPTEIPYSSLIAKGMKAVARQQAEGEKKLENQRLTEIDPKTKKPKLKNGINTEKAVEALLLFENTEVAPYQIEEMKATIANLQERVKKLEDWQE